MNYYELLEVSANASPEVIKAAYKSLMQRNHPDKNPNNIEAEERSILLTKAFEILSDKTKRSAYDLELQQLLQPAFQTQASNSTVASTPQYGKRKSFGFTAYVVIFLGLAAWFVWVSRENKQPNAPNLPNPQLNNSLISDLKSDSGQITLAVHESIPLERSIPTYLSDLKINLGIMYSSAENGNVDAQTVLSIRTVGVVVGAFEAEKFISFLADNKPQILMKLSEKLETANIDSLQSNMGEQYLKELILKSLGEITQTDRFAEYPVAGSNISAHYGVVEIILPDYFSVISVPEAKL
ncbi:MAG: DnaJ domain-containing protein [Sideroxydans sp.]|nr:DnaJ domain-containing protein [Sideroxydans sp.]